MRLFSILRKNFREQKRDPWVLALSMVFAPLFVFLYYLFTGGTGSTSYSILVLSALYFGAGVWFFQRMHLRRG